MKTLWIARHARPLIDTDRCYGRLDVAADPHTTHQAAQALQQVLSLVRDDLQIWHSPLQRCRQLAVALNTLAPELTSSPDNRLMEMDFGHWEGQRWDAIGEAAINTWAQNLAGHAPGDGESLQAMLQRVALALQDACHSTHHHTLWISHAGVARCAQWLVQRGQTMPQSQEWSLPAPSYGQWIKISLS